MPTYLFGCAACGWKIEKFMPMSESDNPVRCPNCGKQMRHILSATPLSGKRSTEGKGRSA